MFTEDSYFEPLPSRRPRVAIDRSVREAGIEKAIRTVVIWPLMIYGRRGGLQPETDRIPKLTALFKQVAACCFFAENGDA